MVLERRDRQGDARGRGWACAVSSSDELDGLADEEIRGPRSYCS